jgi:hypothetical protein
MILEFDLLMRFQLGGQISGQKHHFFPAGDGRPCSQAERCVVARFAARLSRRGALLARFFA